MFFTLLLSGCGGGRGASDSNNLPTTTHKAAAAVVTVPAQLPRDADAFVDAIGINTHLGYSDTAYVSAWSKVQSRLLALGVRHVRDGLLDTTWQPYYQHLNALGAAGIHADLITAVGASSALLIAYPSRVLSSLEAYEGPNEYNASGDPKWASDLTTFQQTLYSTVRGHAATSQYPVIGPALSTEEAFAAVGNISGSQTEGNLHVYFSGRNPGTSGWGDTDSFGTYGSIAYNAALGRSISGNENLIVTETGYDESADNSGYVPSAVKVRYTLRSLLEFWNNGITRTYLYELLDEGGQQDGLLDASANPKPVYTAVKNLITALSDAGASFATKPLPYSVTGASTVHQSLFQKRDGSYVLALWNEVPSWNPITNALQTVASQKITLSLGAAPSSISAATFADAGTLAASSVTIASGSAYTLSLSDRVTLLTIKP